MMLPDRQRYLVSETAIGGGMNMVMSLVGALVSGGGEIRPPTTGALLLQTFMVVFMSVLVATLLTRMRRRRGRFASPRDTGARFGGLVPRSAPVRALLAGSCGLLILGPVVGAMARVLLAVQPAPVEIAVATAAYALLLSVLITPAALILALDDAVAEPSPVAR